MKWLKRISLVFGILIFTLFLIYGVEYDSGYKYPKTNECKFPNGKKKVYVHWIKVLNNTRSNFCDYSLTPLYYNKTKKYSCNCE